MLIKKLNEGIQDEDKDENKDEDEDNILCIQVAGLCHDLGMSTSIGVEQATAISP